MKIVFSIFLLFFNILAVSQQIVDEKIKTLPNGRKVKLVTTLSSERPMFQDMLTPGYERHRIILQDSINKSDFEVKYYLEEHQSDYLKTEGMALHPSSNSYYINELIINRMTNNFISIILQIPGFTQCHYIPSIDNNDFSVKTNHLKWKIFTETPFTKNVPVFVIYSENPDKDIKEKKMDRLFQSPSFKTLKDKDKIINQIKSVTDYFFIVFYDVVLKK